MSWARCTNPGVEGRGTLPDDFLKETKSIRGKPALPKRTSRTYFSGAGDRCFRVHENSLRNVGLGLWNRVLRYKGNVVEAPAAYPRRFKLERALRTSRCTPLSLDQVVATALPRRRKAFGEAVQSLRSYPLTRADAEVSTFLKAEKFDWTSKPDADPRLIQPRSTRFLAVHGRYIKAIEKKVYQSLKLLSPIRAPMVAKGFDALETARILLRKWQRFRDPVCISLDASRFDLHVSEEALKLTHRVYKRYLGTNLPEFNYLCRLVLETRGKARAPMGGYKYRVKGRRMSGDMDTSLGNCLIMCTLAYELCGAEFEIFNNGDDCLIIGERYAMPSPSTLKDHFLRYGFKVTEERRVSVFEQVKFCQTQPVMTYRGPVMVRPPTHISKDLTCVGTPTSDSLWLAAVRECGLALTDGVPVSYAFYTSLPKHKLRKISGSALYSCGLMNLRGKMRDDGGPVTDEARVSYMKAFGVDPGAQRAFEESLRPCGIITTTYLNHTHGKAEIFKI